MKQSTISAISPSRHAEVAEVIEKQLLHSLARLNTQSKNSSIVLTAESDEGQMIGGLCGSTSYGWFLVKILWVDENFRHSGIGRKLMEDAEVQAKELGCHSAWLDTSNSAAKEFYHRLGYSDFGKLENGPENEPAEHRRWFMQKQIPIGRRAP